MAAPAPSSVSSASVGGDTKKSKTSKTADPPKQQKPSKQPVKKDRYKVLMLHGYGMSGETFEKSADRLIKKLKVQLLDCTFVTAPHTLSALKDGKSQHMWWYFDANDKDSIPDAL